MTKSQFIGAINLLRKPGDPLIPGTKKEMEERLTNLRRRETAREALKVFHALERKNCFAYEWLMLKLGCSSNEATDLSREVDRTGGSNV